MKFWRAERGSDPGRSGRHRPGSNALTNWTTSSLIPFNVLSLKHVVSRNTKPTMFQTSTLLHCLSFLLVMFVKYLKCDWKENLPCSAFNNIFMSLFLRCFYSCFKSVKKICQNLNINFYAHILSKHIFFIHFLTIWIFIFI